MNKVTWIAMILLVGIGTSSCMATTGKHKSKDENCGTLEVCDGGHTHHNSRKHYDRH